jgi:hypothetical protein
VYDTERRAHTASLLKDATIMKISRRNFHTTALLALAAGACSVVPQAYAATPGRYRHRLRFHRQGHTYRFWLRITQQNNLPLDVPYKMLLSTDAKGKTVIHTHSHVSRAAASHIVRGKINMAEAGWTIGSPLYVRLLLGNEQKPTRIRRLLKRPAHA